MRGLCISRSSTGVGLFVGFHLFKNHDILVSRLPTPVYSSILAPRVYFQKPGNFLRNLPDNIPVRAFVFLLARYWDRPISMSTHIELLW